MRPSSQPGADPGLREPPVPPDLALHTDHYELTMLDAVLTSGVVGHQAVFEVFARSLPGGRRYGVLAGTDRVVRALSAFRFDPDTLSWLRHQRIVSAAAQEWLSRYRFHGSIDGYPEGEVYLPGSPVLTVRGTFAEALLLETFVLSVLNFDSAVATAASRLVMAAAGRRLVEMGSRRTHEEAGVAAARSAYLAGFAASANLAAGRRYGVPTTGTAAHAFTLAHRDEAAAFAAQVATLGTGTTLLVDTYDVAEAVRRAVAAAGPQLGAVRIDSGDLAASARAVRAQLDGLGATGTTIVATGDLDETKIAGLVDAGAPIDAFGVGTSLVSGPWCPSPGFIYKLVAVADRPGADAPLRPVAKRSEGKETVGGAKSAFRRVADGQASAELIIVDDRSRPLEQLHGLPSELAARPLQVPLVRHGQPVGHLSAPQALDRARRHLQTALAELPEVALALTPGEAALPVEQHLLARP
jgi:nicotinate phosphoribosyltransferase